MQYYIDFLDNSLIKNYEYGVLKYEDQKYYVNDKEIINNRGITNDIVYIDDKNNVVGIKERVNKYFVGILHLDSKTKYGNNKYLFKSLNKKFTDFFVSSKHKNERNMYVKIQLNTWDRKEKFPSGFIMEYIGYVGDIEAESEALRYYYDIYKPSMKINKEKINNDLKILEEIDLTDYELFSIDPDGSKDIDDAFHFTKINDYHNDYTNLVKYEVGVHIAHPTYFLFDYIEEIMSRVSTVYLPHKKYPMLPDIYSDNILSLLENNRRIAFSVIYTFDDKFTIEKFEIKETYVINLKNYTYNEFDLLFSKKNKLLNNIDKNAMDLLNFSKIFFGISEMDSHLFVEKWMIHTNNTVAKYLVKYNVNNIIIRTQNKSSINNDNSNITNEDVIKYINIKNEESAKYEIYNKDSINSPHHYRLNLDYYTHFTSPIRRSVDFYIHTFFLGKRNIFTNENLNKIVDNINLFTKNQRKFQRQLRRLLFLSEIKNNKDELIVDAYIIEIRDRYLIIYIPKYNLEEKICIIQKKFEKIIKSNILLNDKNNIEKINIINENEEITYELYQKLNVKMHVFLLFDSIFDKVKIEIVK